ncbi:glutamate racemase [Schnuerera sp. xch1]|uniref:glutamate racemase n=1 Tax=Schnuerera sp. xch1 TaxID=2874283 RepID=UPI001CBBEBFC|nr:glutamate racemase [Schnuerera sp. xch1]MBZ2175103.1 glutamate racemase [Schnuerera sp. xch1]
MDDRPIGVFDSGVGGLTVLKELIEKLPGEDVVYFGDTARIPYGSRSKETVIKYFLQSVRFLLTKDIKAIVVACNTASALAMEEAQKVFEIPILGVIEPGAEAAIAVTRNSKIGVIGTEGTINSQSYQRRMRRMLPSAEIIGISCPLFVPIVEEGWENSDVAFMTAKQYLLELKEHNIDSLVLGCTHYPTLRYTIDKVLEGKVNLINPAYETAKAAKIMLKESNLTSSRIDGGKCEFYVSDDPEKFKRIGGNILKKEIASIRKVNIENM